jgi:hypothetical protein
MISKFNAFGNWLIAHRYEAENNIKPLNTHLNDWKDSAEEIQKVLNQASIDGVL